MLRTTTPWTVVQAINSVSRSLRRLAVKVALAQICGKEVAEKVEIKKTEDG